jgi:hypothetical protein
VFLRLFLDQQLFTPVKHRMLKYCLEGILRLIRIEQCNKIRMGYLANRRCLNLREIKLLVLCGPEIGARASRAIK